MDESTTTYIARARTDAKDRLIAADEPLASLQRRAGGEIPGTIAIPELREQVRKARRTNLRLGRTIHAFDGTDRIKSWMEIVPVEGDDQSESGCSIGIVTWQASPPPVERDDEAAARRDAIDDALAELHARLDPAQKVLTVHTDAEDLQPLLRRMSENLGQPWTDFVNIAGSQHAQPLHWRLLDQSRVSIDGSPRQWTARLIPLGEPTPGSQGFELYLIANRAWVTRAQRRDRRTEDGASIGRDLTPILRQPIARIVANAETIRARLAGPLGDEYSEYARDIVNAGQHLLSLVDDLTDLEVVEADGFRAAPDPIDLADVARRAAGILAVRAQEKRIRISAPPAPDHAQSDRQCDPLFARRLDHHGEVGRRRKARARIGDRSGAGAGRAGAANSVRQVRTARPQWRRRLGAGSLHLQAPGTGDGRRPHHCEHSRRGGHLHPVGART